MCNTYVHMRSKSAICTFRTNKFNGSSVLHPCGALNNAMNSSREVGCACDFQKTSTYRTAYWENDIIVIKL